jgi:hypothetical protein
MAAQPREALERLSTAQPITLGLRQLRHRSRGRAALPATPTAPAPERRAAAAGRCTPRRSRGTLKDGRCRPESCGDCSALSRKGQQSAEVTPVGLLKSGDVVLAQG